MDIKLSNGKIIEIDDGLPQSEVNSIKAEAESFYANEVKAAPAIKNPESKKQILKRVANRVGSEVLDSAQTFIDPVAQPIYGAAEGALDLMGVQPDTPYPEPKTLVGRIGKTAGKIAGPIVVPGAAPAQLSGALTAISLLPKGVKFANQVKNGIAKMGEAGFRPIYDFVLKGVNNISTDSADFLYNSPEIVPKLSKMKTKMVEQEATDFTEKKMIKQRVSVGEELRDKANNKQKKAFDFIEKNLGYFLNQLSAPTKTDIIKGSNIPDEFQAALLQSPKSVFSNAHKSKEYPAAMANVIIKNFVEKKHAVGSELGQTVSKIMENSKSKFNIDSIKQTFESELKSKGVLPSTGAIESASGTELTRTDSGANIAKKILNEMKKETFSPRELHILKKNISDSIYESRSSISNESKTMLKGLAKSISKVLETNYEDYKQVNAKYETVISQIDRTLGEDMADTLPSQQQISSGALKTFEAVQKLRNRIMSATGNSGEKAMEDLGGYSSVDVLGMANSLLESMPQVANQLRAFIIDKSTRKDVVRTINAAKMDLSSFGNLTSRISAIEEGFPIARKLLREIDSNIPKEIRYLGNAKAALAWGEAKQHLDRHTLTMLGIAGLGIGGATGYASGSPQVGIGTALGVAALTSPRNLIKAAGLGKKGISQTTKRLLRNTALKQGAALTRQDQGEEF